VAGSLIRRANSPPNNARRNWRLLFDFIDPQQAYTQQLDPSQECTPRRVVASPISAAAKRHLTHESDNRWPLDPYVVQYQNLTHGQIRSTLGNLDPCVSAIKGLANVQFQARWMAQSGQVGLCTPIGMPTNGYHGDTDEMLRRQPLAYSVQTSCTDILLPHLRPHVMTVSSHPICLFIDNANPFSPYFGYLAIDHPARPTVTHL